MCQDPLGSPVDLSTPQAMAVTMPANPSRPQRHAGLDLRQRDSQVGRPDGVPALQELPFADGSLFAGPAELRSNRQLSHRGRGGSVDRSERHVRAGLAAGGNHRDRRSGPSAKAVVSSGVLDGCSVQQMTSYAMGLNIQKYNTCELNTIRAQTDGTIKSLFSNVLLASFMRARTGGTK